MLSIVVHNFQIGKTLYLLKARQRKCDTLVNRVGDLVSGGMDKADRFNVFFALVFTRKVSQVSCSVKGLDEEND